MRSVDTVAELRSTLAAYRRADARIGLVPTMGALHAGHMSLIARAREQCDVVVVSLFVNPTQFNEQADLARYPRDLERDSQMAAGAGADILFAPPVKEVYPPGFSSEVRVSGITERLEGTQRGPEHFNGVSTVVCKLFGMVGPDVAYFGQKDAQQVLVIRHLVEDLNIPVRIEMCPTVRERDGLALSSRNMHLSASERQQALGLYAALSAAGSAVSQGRRDHGELLAAATTELERRQIQPEYLELVDLQTLEPLQRLDRSALLAIAARIGATRLIDNVILTPTPTPQPSEREATTTCSA